MFDASSNKKCEQNEVENSKDDRSWHRLEAHVFGIVDGRGVCRRHLSVSIAVRVDGL